MVNLELVNQLRQLSHRDKLNVIQLLVSELNLLDLDRNLPLLQTNSPVQTHQIEPSAPQIISIQRPQAQSSIAILDAPVVKTSPITAASQVPASQILPSRFIQLQNFFPTDEHHELVRYALDRQAEFTGTTTSTGEAEYRQSSVLYHFPEMRSRIEKYIHAALPTVLSALQLEPFEIKEIEAQLTAHNDGHYYRVHNDNGSTDTANRLLTYVYYFNHEPKQFNGGALRIYDSQVKNRYYIAADSYQDVMPDNNSIVFFLSRYMHEVLPITCDSKQFQDSRFTINGWLRN
jgi:SM-20-related protein